MKKQAAVLLAVLSGVYLFVPEPTDVFPIVGWLDEGLALAMLGWSLRTLGVDPRRMFRRTFNGAAVREPARVPAQTES